MKSKCISHRGFTLIELVVTLGVVGLILAVSIPAIQSSREAARRASCLNHLKQIGVASQTYFSGTRSVAKRNRAGSFLVHILPEIEETLLHDQAEGFGWLEFQFHSFAAPETYICPSEIFPREREGFHSASYVANFGTGFIRSGYDGFFRGAGGSVAVTAVIDGLSNTAMISECLFAADTQANRRIYSTPEHAGTFENLRRMIRELADGNISSPRTRGRGTPWTDGNVLHTGYHHAMLPNESSGFNGEEVQEGLYSAVSNHPGGVHVLNLDGHIDFVSESIDEVVWWAKGSRDGREVNLPAR